MSQIKSIKIGILIIGIALILIFGVKWIIQYKQINSCLDKGGKWNHDLKICEFLFTTDTIRIADYYWKSDYDTIINREYLIRGELIDSIAKSPNELIEVLNKRPSKSKIDYVGLSGDTLRIRILEEKYLTEQMGTTGAYCYMAETVYTLTENDLIKFVRFEMEYGSHAGPGVYSRKDYEQMIR